uniref:maleylpyruvate isomerase family mycothiol-dependent enzyme n=1 Tax=Pseudonocardia pini TaxID=2758030 RepID=UPI0015F06589
MTALVPDPTATLTETRVALARFAALVRRIGPADPTAVGTWSVRDVAAHVAESMDLYTGLLAGEPSPASSLAETAAMSAAAIATVTDREPEALARAVETAASRYLAAAGAATDPVGWHGGLPLPVSSLLGLTLGEALVHGRDVARALGVPWEIPPAAAHTVLLGILPVIPLSVDRAATAGVHARFDVRLR